MKEFNLCSKDLKQHITELTVGDKVYLSGTVYTSRDAAHKRIFELLESDKPLPYNLDGAIIYYAGPTPTPKDLPIGSCGPTTSCRMDPYTPKLYDLGVIATIGKGERSSEVVDAIKRNGAVYLCAIGGAGALLSQCIKSNEAVAFEDLGAEALHMLYVEDMPLTVIIDCEGNNLYKIGRRNFLKTNA